MIRRFVVVPPVPALLPHYASLHDPVAELRMSAVAAVQAITRGAASVAIVGDDPFAEPVARALLDAAGFGGSVDPDAEVVLVMANGTAKRTEKAPGHLDARAADFDDALDLALRSGAGARLAVLDPDLARELWASGLEPLRALGERLGAGWQVSVPYADAPYGVLWWVAAWLRP
ncbi:hypothetical protein AFL01nite_07250 [Aeromicrobium flavum]|uniref:Uncharacterized protein n=1 Tax=Aeromicrobium flavum TaxID=416568 RepID=A0A512HSG3_9ACTN|nr:hypothetical protein [Aeromicrobium flavum]GEO88398.1 hypothetical protein AFL01nite_07250 [Aeromicrobium flavum]